MNRKRRKLEYIRRKNAYRKMGLKLDSVNTITYNYRTFSFYFTDVVRMKGVVLIFTKKFYERLMK